MVKVICSESVTDWANIHFIYEYDEANRLTHLTLPNGLISSYEYDLAGQLTHLRHDAPTQTLANYLYTLAENGNRTQVAESVISPPLTPTTPLSGSFFIYLPIIIKGQSGAGRIINYIYDTLQRLVEARYSTGETYQYDYDAVGNRVIQSVNGITTAYQYDPSNRLSAVNGQSYIWDNNGNLLETGNSTNIFDAQNRLIQSQRSSTTLQPIYDGLNNRVAQVKNGMTTTFALDVQGLPEVIYTSDGNKYLHLPGVIVTENITGERRYLLTDGLGSVRQVVDESGKVVAKYEFDPYGNPIEDESNPYGYTGEWWESELGLLHLRARWYVPEDGIFLSKDQWDGNTLRPQTLNGWNYVEGNPINLTDPSGLCSKLPQLGPSDCEKFVAEVEQFITLAQTQKDVLNIGQISDDYIVAMLAAYYSDLTLTTNIGSTTILVPFPFNIPNLNLGNERWPLENRRQAAYSLDKYHDDYKKYPEPLANVAALNYGFKRNFYDNSHHYFANFYLSWFYNAPLARLSNNIWEEFNRYTDPHGELESAADFATVEVAINHVKQTKGWFNNNLTLLPSLIRDDLCGDTIEAIYGNWKGVQ